MEVPLKWWKQCFILNCKWGKPRLHQTWWVKNGPDHMINFKTLRPRLSLFNTPMCPFQEYLSSQTSLSLLYDSKQLKAVDIWRISSNKKRMGKNWNRVFENGLKGSLLDSRPRTSHEHSLPLQASIEPKVTWTCTKHLLMKSLMIFVLFQKR